MDGYVSDKQWKRNEYNGTHRLMASIIDLCIIGLLNMLVFFVLLQLFNITPTLETTELMLSTVLLPLLLHFIGFHILYVLYHIITFVLLGCSFGQRLCNLTYVRRIDTLTFGHFFSRLVLSVSFFMLLSLMGFFYIPLIYYGVKIYDPYSGPFWDKHFKLITDTRLLLSDRAGIKYTFSLGMVIVLGVVSFFTFLPFIAVMAESTSEFFVEMASSFDEISLEDLEYDFNEGNYEKIVSMVESMEDQQSIDPEILNKYGLALIYTGEAEKAVEVYTNLLSQRQEEISLNLIDAIHNNIGWAYNEIGEYELAIEELTYALSLEDNSSFEYSNLGNSYYMLNNYEEAIVNYEEALTISEYQDYILYNLGECYHYMENYPQAIDYFNQYLELYPEDIDTITYLGWSVSLAKESYDEGLIYFKQAIETDEESSYAIFSILEYMNYYEHYEESLAIGKEIDPSVIVDNDYITEEILTSYYYLGLYDEGLAFAKKYVTENIENTDLRYQLLDFYYNTGKHAEAKKWLDQLSLDLDYDNQMELANLYQYNYYYLDAAKIYDTIVQKKEELALSQDQWELALFNLLDMYYLSDYFDEVIALCETYEGNIETFNIHQTWGNSIFQIGDTTQATIHLNKALAFEPTVSLYEDRIYLNAYLGNLDEALKDLEKAYELGMPEEDYNYHKEYLNDQLTLTPGQQIFKFLKQNYMYTETLEKPEVKAIERNLSNKTKLETKDYETINSQVFRDDYFSFVLYDEWFSDVMLEEGSATVTYNTYDDSTFYTKIDFFSGTTDTEFLRALKEIPYTLNKKLVIDLCGNTGGDTESAFNILDYLINSSYLGTWDALDDMDYDYYSDGNQIEFNHIYILVDDQSASSSEVIALGLSEYLTNTTIIGETTFGKGVGQLGLLNLKEEFSLYAVNAYWSIHEKNIHGVGIEPDIELLDGTLEDYMAVVSRK